MIATQFSEQARRRSRVARSALAPLFRTACVLPQSRAAAIRSICWLEGGQMWSQTFRELMRLHYGVEIGLHSYGPCLWPGHLPPGTRIGNYCSLGPGIQVLRRNHPTDRLSQHPFFFNSATGLLTRDTIPAVAENPLSIGHDVWIGLGVVVAPSCKQIGDGAVVAARAVLTADVPSLAVVGGVPAKFIRWRFPEHLHDAWLKSGWWMKPVDALEHPADAFLERFRGVGPSMGREPDGVD